MYDFVMGATLAMEIGIANSEKNLNELRKGLDWFRQHNSKAYMVLLD